MRSVLAHAALAALGLLLAYQTWTRDEEAPTEKAEGEAVVLACEEAGLETFGIESPTHVVTVVPTSTKGADGAAQTVYWVTSQKKKKEDKKDESGAKDGDQASDEAGDTKAGEGDETPTTRPADEPTTQPTSQPADPTSQPAKQKKNPRPYDPEAPVVFLADAKKFTKVVQRLTPLRAVRSLGAVPEDKLETFGFDDIGTFLRVECGGQKLELGIGARTYGTGNRYAQNDADEQAYLMEGKLVMDLQSARVKYMQTTPHAFEPSEVDAATIRARGLEKKLLQRYRENKERAQWVDADDPDRRNELYGNWFQRLSRLKVKGYLPEGAEPGSDLKIPGTPPEDVLTIEYSLEGKAVGKLELVRVNVDEQGFYYARTETSQRWTTMYDSIAKQVEQDVGLVVGAEEPSEAVSSEPEQSPPAGEPPPGIARDPHAH
ncbi:MAG: hypothetical protein OXT09_13250 [Myxococcales bacterium]|nr:hypothetical protein [Myxococcales bacterium]